MDRKAVEAAIDTMTANLYPDEPFFDPLLWPDLCVGCNSEEWTYLGQLGQVFHYRCRHCGLDASVERA